MTSKQERAWAGAVNIIIDNGKILLMKRSDQSRTYPGHWGLVGGFLEFGETAEEGSVREAKEEIGVEVEVIKFIGRYYNTEYKPGKNVISLPHYSTIISGKPHPAQPEECSDVKWFEPDAVRKMELAYDHKKILEDEGLI